VEALAWCYAIGHVYCQMIGTLIQTAKLNDVDPQAWLADVFARINDHNIQNLDQLLPWNWKKTSAKLAA